jgi:hypothetical protein
MKGRILKSQLQEELNTIFDIACQVKKYPLHLSMREYTKEHNNSVSPLENEFPDTVHILFSCL